MTRTTSLAALLLMSSSAYAHDGHPHVGNEVVHHALEGLAVVALAGVVWLVWSRLRARQDDTRSNRTINS